MVVAFAGRRIDAPNADPPRFPPRNAERVRADVRAKLDKLGARTLVASAACGADILALEAAEALGVRHVIVLPFARDDFLKSSVIDRGDEDDWAHRFEHLTTNALALGDLHELMLSPDDTTAYATASTAILDLAQQIARESNGSNTVALIAWDGPRDSADITKQFKEDAQSRAIEVIEVSTL